MRAGAYAAIVSKAAALRDDGVDREGQLELRVVDGQLAHVLQNRPLSRGEMIEVRLTDGTWLPGHYEWSGIEARWPGLRIELGGPWQRDEFISRPPAAVVALHPDAIVRRR